MPWFFSVLSIPIYYTKYVCFLHISWLTVSLLSFKKNVWSRHGFILRWSGCFKQGTHTETVLILGSQIHRLKKPCWVSLFVFFAQHICIFFQWLSLACDFTCLFCKVPWIWVCGSFSAPDEHSLRGQSLDCGPFCWRWVSVLSLSLDWHNV